MWTTIVGGVALAVTPVYLAAALLVAPPDAVQGDAQRLMYVHVPAAWVAFLMFFVVLVSSAAYLVRRDLRWDRRARAAAELGVGLTALTIALGSIWGRVTWGVWWTWDARLLTTAVLLLVYVGYLGVRGLSEDPDLNARRAAVVGLLAFVNVPMVHFSVVWWRTLHQEPTLLAPEPSPPIASSMVAPLLLGVLTFSLWALWVVRRRLAGLCADAGHERATDHEAATAPIVVTRTARTSDGPS